MNLFLTLHALGLGHELHGEHLLPIGTVYDPFVRRGLDALIYGLYNGACFIVIGTPSGITLARGRCAPEHDHGVDRHELPGLTFAEPAFATRSTGRCATASTASRGLMARASI